MAEAARSFGNALGTYRKGRPSPTRPGTAASVDPPIADGSVVIAAITSCTNTSNPYVMVGAGLIAQKALSLGLKVPPHVKTSLAPGSKVVTDYLEKAGLMAPLAGLGFALVGYGCTTCIGNSGPLPPAVAQQVVDRDLYVAAVLSGNRNFEARIQNLVRANYLASPMLVVAYALAGRMDLNLTTDPLGRAADGTPVFLRDLWPGTGRGPRGDRTEHRPGDVPQGVPVDRGRRRALGITSSPARSQLRVVGRLDVPRRSAVPPTAPPVAGPGRDSRPLRAAPRGHRGPGHDRSHLARGRDLGDVSAGAYLRAHGVPPSEFNTYGARRGHHEVLVRGTFANVRLKNELVRPKEGGYTRHLPSGDTMTVFDAAERYRTEGVPLLVFAGKSYGQGSSRDWAAKGPRLLGVGAVIAEGFERIHRTNLIEMGVLPLSYLPGENWASLGLTGRETFELVLPPNTNLGPGVEVEVTARPDVGPPKKFLVECRLHSATELAYYRAGGVLPYVMEHRFAK